MLDHLSPLPEVSCGYVTEHDRRNIGRCGKCHLQPQLIKTSIVVLRTPLLVGWNGGHRVEGILGVTP